MLSMLLLSSYDLILSIRGATLDVVNLYPIRPFEIIGRVTLNVVEGTMLPAILKRFLNIFLYDKNKAK